MCLHPVLTPHRGRRCPETGSLELHHREAHALGGPDSVDNLELRCPPHNLLAAEQDFGRSHMDRRRGKAPPSLAAREGSDHAGGARSDPCNVADARERGRARSPRRGPSPATGAEPPTSRATPAPEREKVTSRAPAALARETVTARPPAAPAREAMTARPPAALAREAETSRASAGLARETVTARPPAAPAREAVTSRAPAALARRHVSAAIRREVWARDAGRCAYTDDRRRRCPETGSLELHHREAHALGGPDSVDNLELRCLRHNFLAAEQDFGRSHMDRRRGKAPPSLTAREGSDLASDGARSDRAT